MPTLLRHPFGETNGVLSPCGNSPAGLFLPPCRPARARKSQAFTLVEICLAVGIFAFCIVGILALFPVGLNSASESRMQSVVTQIARTVLSDLRTGSFKAARVVTAPTPVTAGDTVTFSPFDLSQNPPPPLYVLYLADGTAKSSLTAGEYDQGKPAGDYIVKIESRLISTTAPALAQVTVTVEAPAATTAAHRSKYPVVTLMGDTR